MPSRRRASPIDPTPGSPPDGGSAAAWTPDEVAYVEGYDAVDAPAPVLVGVGVPAVVVVVVTHDPSPTLETTLASIAAQEYASLTTLVIDAASADDPTVRVADALPPAFVKRADSAEFAPAANQALNTVEGAAFYLFCHDDVEFGVGAVQALVEEAFRSNAGIVGAKLVDWDDPERLRDVGASTDKFAFVWPHAEPGELDQAQHDAVRECMVVSTAAMLVRCDLFADLGGFATDLGGVGEDLDFCWRARIAGGRTVVMPAARVRHAERSSIGERSTETDGRLAHRNRGRIVLANYSPIHLLRVGPQALLFALGEMLGALISGRRAAALEIASAVGWNIVHLPSTLRIRGGVKRVRRTPDHEVRRFQVKGSTRFTAFVRDQTSRNRNVAATLAAAAQGRTDGNGPWPVVLAVLVGLALLVGSRHLIGTGIPALREFVPMGRPSELAREWWSGWRATGLGSSGAAPTLNLVAAVLAFVTLGSAGVVRTILIVGLLPLGAVSMWRCLRGAVSTRANIAATLAYVVNPVAYNAISEGRWQALACWAALPAIVGIVARAGGWAPFGRSEASVVRDMARLGALLALATTLAPVAAVLTFVVAAVVVLVLGATDREGSPVRAVQVVCGALAISAVLHLPWTVGVLTSDNRWSVLFGADPTRIAPVRLTRALVFDTGRFGGLLSIGLLLAAFVAVAIAADLRQRWAIVGATLAVAAFAGVVIAGRLAPSVASPPTEVLVALAAVGVSLAIGFGVDAFRVDVAGGTFGWRQVAFVVAAASLIVSGLPFAGAVLDGRWGMIPSDVDRALSPIDPLVDQPNRAPNGRTLWIGDGDVLAKQGWSLGDGVRFALTDGVRPTFSSVFPSPMADGERALRDVVRDLIDSRSSRLGERLAPFSIRYIVVADRLASLPYGRAVTAVPERITTRLEQQFDIAQIEVAPGLRVYENIVTLPIRSTTDTPDGDVVGWVAAARAPTRYTGTPGGTPLVVLQNRDDGWSANGAGPEAPDLAGARWASSFEVEADERVELAYATPLTSVLLHLVQLGAVVALAVTWRRTRPTATPAVPDLVTEEPVS